jgi:LysR family glycine cleavage system transcriptional activator
LTAAEQQQGVALAYDAMARNTLEAGRLVRLFNIETPARTIYSFAHAATRRRCPDIRRLRQWLFDEVAAQGLLRAG